MSQPRSTWRRTLAAAFAMLAVAAGTAAAQPSVPAYAPPYVKSSLVQVDVYDRFDGSALAVHQKDGRHFIVGVPGHEYAVRIRNCTGSRILVVTSVDGVNVISGDTAAPGQSGYVLDAWSSVEIAGWRKSMERTAAFYFTDLGDSYAARTGRPQNVGVIGLAVFQEKPKRIVYREKDVQDRLAAAETPAPVAKAERHDAAAPSAPAASPPAASADARGNVAESVAQGGMRSERKQLSNLGTGHGRSEDSRVTLTQFERATSLPAETVAIRYDRRENLIALGVLPDPVPPIARRDPNPFPASMRFAPDPNR